MGEQNDLFCSYLRKNSHFADCINGSLFFGSHVIHPEDLSDVPEGIYETLQNQNGNSKRVKGIRDVVKLFKRGNRAVILSIEIQDKVHYAMPLRCMKYENLDYMQQLRHIRRKHKETGDLKSGSEYLSQMKSGDKFIPVITLVLYLGFKPWNGSLQLYDLLDFGYENEMFRQFTNNYRMNLIRLNDIHEEYFESSLHEIFGMMKRANDKDAMAAFCAVNAERLNNLDDYTYDVIVAMTHHKALADFKDKVRNKGGKLDMCKAFKEMMNDSEKKGFKIGEEKGERKATLLCIRNLSHKMQISAEQAMQILGIPQNKQISYLQDLQA